MSRQMFPQYSTMKFTDVWDNSAEFVSDYKSSGLYVSNNKISDESATALFYLLYARYGNSPMANRDVNQFQYKIFSVIFQYGPTWEKELDVQSKVRALTDEQIRLGSKETAESMVYQSFSEEELLILKFLILL